MVQFGEFLKNWSLQSNSVTRQVSSNRTKIEGKCQNLKIKCDILKNFQTMCCSVIRSIRICIQTYLASSFCFLWLFLLGPLSGFESRIWSSFVCTRCKIHSSLACTNWGVSKWRCSKRASRPVGEPDLRSGISSIPQPLKTWKPSWETTLTAASPTWVAARMSIDQNTKSNFTRLQTQQIRPLRVILYDSPSFLPWHLALWVFCALTKNTLDPIKKDGS